MKPILSWLSRFVAFPALGLAAGYVLAQQMVGPQIKPPDAKEIEARKSKGGYFPERMKNPNLSTMPGRLTVTPPSEIPLDRIKLPKGFKVELWAHGMPGVRMMTRGTKGTIWAGTRTIGRVYEIKDQGGSALTASSPRSWSSPTASPSMLATFTSWRSIACSAMTASRTIPTSSPWS